MSGVQRDELSAVKIECPECKQWVHTTPAELVRNQSLRACDGCDAVFLIDIATTTMRPEPVFPA